MSKLLEAFATVQKSGATLPSQVVVIDKTVKGTYNVAEGVDTVIVNGPALSAAVYGNGDTTVKGYATTGKVKSIAAVEVNDTTKTVETASVVADDFITTSLVAAAKSEVSDEYTPVAGTAAQTTVNNARIDIKATAEVTDVYAGAVLTDSASSHAYVAGRTALINNSEVNVYGAKVSSIHAGGIGANAITVNASVNVVGAVVSSIYAGGKLGAHNTGNVEISVKNSKISDIYLHGENSIIEGNVTLNIGNGSSIGTIHGCKDWTSCSTLGYADGTKYAVLGDTIVNFQDYKGNFTGAIKNVDKVTISGDSAVVFTKAQDSSMKYADYVINISEANSYNQAAFMTFNSSVNLNSLEVHIDAADINDGSFTSTLVKADKSIFNSSTFDTTNVCVTTDDGLVADYKYDVSFATTTDKKGNEVETGELVFTYTGKALTVYADGYKNNVLTSANDDVVFAYSHNGTVLDIDYTVMAFDFATMAGNDNVTINSDISFFGTLDLGKGDDSVKVNGYLGSLKLGAGSNNVIINGQLNTENIAIDANSENTFVLNGSFAKTTYDANTKTVATGRTTKIYIYSDGSTTEDEIKAGKTIVTVKEIAYDANGKITSSTEYPYVDEIITETLIGDEEKANNLSAAQNFVVSQGKNTLVVNNNAGVSNIYMSGDFAQVVLADANAFFQSGKLIDLSAAAASVLLIENGGNLNNLTLTNSFKGSAKNSTIIFDGDAQIAMAKLLGMDDNDHTHLQIAAGSRVEITDLDIEAFSKMDIQIGTNAMIIGANDVLLGENFNGIISATDFADTSVPALKATVYATNLTDAVLNNFTNVIVSGNVSGTIIKGVTNVQFAGKVDNSQIVLTGTLALQGGADIQSSTVISTADDPAAAVALQAVTVLGFDGTRSVKFDAALIANAITNFNVGNADFTLGSNAVIGDITNMNIENSVITLANDVNVTTAVNVIGEGDFKVSGALIETPAVNFGVAGQNAFVGYVDDLFTGVDQKGLTVTFAGDSVAKFSKDAALCSIPLYNTTFTLNSGATLELDKNVKVRLEQDTVTASGPVAVAANIVGDLTINGNEGSTIAGNISLGKGANDLTADTVIFTGIVTANDIIAKNVNFKDNVVASNTDKHGVMADNTVFGGTVIAADVIARGCTFTQDIAETVVGTRDIADLTSFNSTFQGDVLVTNLVDSASTFNGNVTGDTLVHMSGSTVTGEGLTVTGDIVIIDEKANITANVEVSAAGTTQTIAIADSTINGNVATTVNPTFVTLNGATINGLVGDYDNAQVSFVNLEGVNTVTDRITAAIIRSGDEAGTVTVDTVRVNQIGFDDRALVTVNARELLSTDIQGSNGIVDFVGDVAANITKEMDVELNVKAGANLALNSTVNSAAIVDRDINVRAGASLTGNIQVVNNSDAPTLDHYINLYGNAKLDGTVAANVQLQGNANVERTIGGTLTGNVTDLTAENAGGSTLNLLNGTVVNGTITNANELFVEPNGSATVTAIVNSNTSTLSTIVGNLTVIDEIEDNSADVVLGRTVRGDDPAYNTNITGNVHLNDSNVEIRVAEETLDAINGTVRFDSSLSLCGSYLGATIPLVVEDATLTITNVTASDTAVEAGAATLFIDKNVDVTGAVTLKTASNTLNFGTSRDNADVARNAGITGQVVLATESTINVAANASVAGGISFDGALTIDMKQADTSLKATVTGSGTPDTLNLITAGYAEFGAIDLGEAVSVGDDGYLVDGTNTLDVSAVTLPETYTGDQVAVKIESIKSAGDLTINGANTEIVLDADGNYTQIDIETATINHTGTLTLNSTVKADINGHDLQLGADVLGTVTADTMALADSRTIYGDATVATSLEIGANTLTVDNLNGDFLLSTDDGSITGNINGNVRVDGSLTVNGNVNSLTVVSDLDSVVYTINGNASKIDLSSSETSVLTVTGVLGNLTTGSGEKMINVFGGSTGTIDLSNATSSSIELGVAEDDLNAASFGAVIGSEGADSVTLNAGVSYTIDAYGNRTDAKFSTFKSFDFSKIDYKAAYGETEPAMDTLTAFSVEYETVDEFNDAHVTITDGVKFANLTVTGHIIGNFTGADNAIAGTTDVTYVDAVQAAKSIGKYGPVGQPDDLNVGAIYKDALTVSDNVKIEGTVDMGKGADVITTEGYVDIDAIKFGTSETIVSQAKDQTVFNNPEEDKDYDTLIIGNTLTAGSISFEGNLLIDGAAIKAYGVRSNDMIIDPVNELSEGYANDYGADPSNPQWTSQEYVVGDTGTLKFNLNADGTEVESVTFVAKDGAFDLINGGKADQELTIAQALTVTGNINMGTGDDTLTLNADLTLQGFGDLSALNTRYTWNGDAFVGSTQDGLVYGYENVGELTFGGNGTIDLNGNTLTATIVTAKDLVLTNAGTITAQAITANTITLTGAEDEVEYTLTGDIDCKEIIVEAGAKLTLADTISGEITLQNNVNYKTFDYNEIVASATLESVVAGGDLTITNENVALGPVGPGCEFAEGTEKAIGTVDGGNFKVTLNAAEGVKLNVSSLSNVSTLTYTNSLYLGEVANVGSINVKSALEINSDITFTNMVIDGLATETETGTLFSDAFGGKNFSAVEGGSLEVKQTAELGNIDFGAGAGEFTASAKDLVVGDITATDALVLNGTFTAGSVTVAEGTLDIDNKITVTGSVTAGAVTFSGTASEVVGAVEATSITGKATISGDVTLNGVENEERTESTINGTFTVGTTEIVEKKSVFTASTIDAGADVVFAQGEIKGNLSVSNTLEVTGALKVYDLTAGTIQVDEKASLTFTNDEKLIEIGGTLELDWMDKAGESFTLTEALNIVDEDEGTDISSVIGSATLKVYDGIDLSFTVADDGKSGVFTSDKVDYCVSAEATGKSIKFTLEKATIA